MPNDLFERRDPPIATANWHPSQKELLHLRAIAERKRTPGALVCELMMYNHYVSVHASQFDPLALLGLHHRIDETALLLALATSQSALDLDIKVATLSDLKPAVQEHIHLRKMLVAGMQADVDRLWPSDPHYRF